jgi:hypothetical protein
VRSGCLDSSGIGEILGIMDNIHDYFDLYLAVPKGSVNDTGVRMLDSKHVDISLQSSATYKAKVPSLICVL